MGDVQRKRPWWHWVLGGFVGLVILSAIFGDNETEPASQVATVTNAAAAPRSAHAPERDLALADARSAADDGRYVAAVSLADGVSPAASAAIRRRIANRIARRALRSVGTGDLRGARARLRQADRFPTTELTRAARASYAAARARSVARATRRRDATALRRRVAANARAARAETQSQPSNCDASYEGACLNPDSADYDCEGGSGNGPDYTGAVRVVGSDHFDLDRDGDGTGCE